MADVRASWLLRHRQLGWAAGGQVLSALSNVLLVVIAAQGSTPSELGGLALVIAVYRLTVAVTRALVSEPVLSLREAHGDPSGPLHAAALLGAAGSVVCLAAALIAGEQARASFLILAVGLPVLCVQDVARYLSIGQGAAGRAARLDATWLGVQLAGALGLAAATAITVELAVTTWVVGGVVAGIAGLRGLRARPSGGRSWLGHRSGTSSLFLVEYAAIHGAVQGAYVLVAAIVSSAAAGAMRGIETLYGPYSIVLLGTRPALVRSLQSHERTPAAWASALRKIAAGLVLVAVATAALVLVLPDGLGELALGDTWPSARDLAPAYAAYAVAVSLSGVPMIGLRARGRPEGLARARAVEAPVSLALVAAGAVWADARGAILGLALGSLLGTALAWRTLRRLEAPAPVTDPGVAPSPPR